MSGGRAIRQAAAKRHQHEAWYTPELVAELHLRWVLSHLSRRSTVSAADLLEAAAFDEDEEPDATDMATALAVSAAPAVRSIVDPCAGGGVYLRVARAMGLYAAGSDPHPTAYGIARRDALVDDLYSADLCITNPPFSRLPELLPRLRARYRYLSLLLPISAIERTRARAPLWAEHPPNRWAEIGRVRFEGPASTHGLAPGEKPRRAGAQQIYVLMLWDGSDSTWQGEQLHQVDDLRRLRGEDAPSGMGRDMGLPRMGSASGGASGTQRTDQQSGSVGAAVDALGRGGPHRTPTTRHPHEVLYECPLTGSRLTVRVTPPPPGSLREREPSKFTRVCWFCGGLYRGRRGARFCSSACRVGWNRALATPSSEMCRGGGSYSAERQSKTGDGYLTRAQSYAARRRAHHLVDLLYLLGLAWWAHLCDPATSRRAAGHLAGLLFWALWWPLLANSAHTATQRRDRGSPVPRPVGKQAAPEAA